VFHVEAKQGGEEACEALLGDLARRVCADEPGCEAYVVTRAMGESVRFVIHARFTDWRAFEEHADTKHMSRIMPRLTALLATPLAMELFLEI
jgi:quinol monooxygenase YgiN